jgi:hypothetical protein
MSTTEERRKRRQKRLNQLRLPAAAVGRGAAFKKWMNVCEAVKKKYRDESGRPQGLVVRRSGSALRWRQKQ